MALLITHTKSSGKPFNYKGVTRTPGAFRVVSVRGLLQTKQEIRLREHATIRFGSKTNPDPTKELKRLNSKKSKSKYVAISHVWSHGDDVDDQLNKMPVKELLMVDVDHENSKNYQERLSWVGLRQAANAAQMQGGDYLWLDFLCLDQKERQLYGKSDKEKALQICIMANIYTAARCVITMIGGIGAVTGIGEQTAWMDRAWTLQEAILNENETWVYIQCPRTQKPKVTDPRGRRGPWRFLKVGAEDVNLDKDPATANTSLFLITLVDLLDLADANPYPSDAPTVGVLDGSYTGIPSDSPRRALRAALCQTNRNVKYTGVWRSMFMRTSSNPVDVVYSIMGIFGLQIDPYRKNRDPKFVFGDLARKTAAKSRCGPAWLTIGGVSGSNLRRDSDSGLVPEFPHYERAGEKAKVDGPPKMTFANGNRRWVGYEVDDTQWYISKFDIRFLTQSHPHIINAIMLPVRGPLRNQYRKKLLGPGGKDKYRYYAEFSIGTLYGNCVYWMQLAGAVERGQLKAVWVGEVGDMRTDVDINIPVTKPKQPNFNRQQYFLFLEWVDNSRWEWVADGVYKPTMGWPLPWGTQRCAFTMGFGAQTSVPQWFANDRFLDISLRNNVRQYKRATYGLEPLEDWRVTNPVNRPITWFGLKDSVPRSKWKQYNIRLDITDLVHNDKKLAQALADTQTIYAVSTLAERGYEPMTTRVDTISGIIDEGRMSVALSYDGWSKSQCADLHRAGVDGILIPQDGKGNPQGKVTYHVRLLFGRQMMYIQMKPDWHTPPAYWQMYAVPYSFGPGFNRPFRNRPRILGQESWEGRYLQMEPQNNAFQAQSNRNNSRDWMDYQRRMNAIGVQPTPRGFYEESVARARQQRGF